MPDDPTDLSAVPPPEPDPEINQSDEDQGSPPGSWKGERPTEQDELEEMLDDEGGD